MNLRSWTRVDSGPFRFSEWDGPGRPDLEALTDAELMDRARALRKRVADALEAGRVPERDRRRVERRLDRVAAL